MENTFPIKIKKLYSELVGRQKMLQEHIDFYKQSNCFEDAMKCGIRLDTIETIRLRLEEIIYQTP